MMRGIIIIPRTIPPASAEKRFMGGDVVGRCARIPRYKQLAWNVDQAQRCSKECEVEESCDSRVPAEGCHVGSPFWLAILDPIHRAAFSKSGRPLMELFLRRPFYPSGTSPKSDL